MNVKEQVMVLKQIIFVTIMKNTLSMNIRRGQRQKVHFSINGMLTTVVIPPLSKMLIH